jgi:cephalosporin-C deacetylase-like acetyl esterase
LPQAVEGAFELRPLPQHRALGGRAPLLDLRTISKNLCISAALFFPLSLYGQEPIRDPLLRWMNQIAQRQLEERRQAIEQIHTVAQAERRKQKVRETLLELLGGLPDYNGPLNARTTGEIKAEGYTIEKVLFQSLPNFYVTGDLYRPNRPGQYPAILYQSGHTQEGKPEPQRAAANLALKGFVVLATDPIGQGEREQTYDPQLSGPLAGWSVPEHIQAGAQAILVGESAARFFVWDAKRAIDYLVSRPDVDATRLGAAGCSGGGALTTFIGALDTRLKAVVPACYPNSYQLLFAGPDPDTEMTFPEFLAHGLDVADFVELSAPTPWLIQATEDDYFTPAGARLVYEEARHWYGIYGAEDKLGFFVGPGPHGTPLVSREALYHWMIRWLEGGQGDFHEQPVHLYTNFELQVTPTGRVEDIPGSRKLYQLILDDFHAGERQGTIPELQAELRRLKIPSDGSPPEMKVLDEQNTPDFQRQHIKFESEPGIEIDGNLYIPLTPAGRKPAILLVADSGPYFQAAPMDSLAARMAKKGRVVLTMEPRDSPGENTHAPFVGNWITNSRANQIGRNLPAMRAHDILRGVDLLSARSDVDPASMHCSARGVKGVWLLLAAAADTRIGKVWLDRSPYSLRAALQHTLNTNLFDAVMPGFALHWDLDDLTKAMGKRPVMWTDPANWMNRIVALPGPYQYRYILGDTTDLAGAQDDAYIDEFLR